MIEGLGKLLVEHAQEGIPELRSLVEALLGGPSARGRFRGTEQLLRDRVYRARFEVDGEPCTLVLKHFPLDRAHREQLAIRRWLPRAGLADHGPTLLGTAAEPSGSCIWFVYEDLGDCSLDRSASDPARVRAAVALIAELHVRFVDHPLLGECRTFGADLGIHFYASSVRDAMRGLEALAAPALETAPQHEALRQRLLHRLQQCLDEEPWRARVMAELGGPETLLHGDLWTTNVLVTPDAQGFRARLIDWDHAGVGPVSYDLSAFLLRFPSEERLGILDDYRAAVGRAGWKLPDVPELNLLFDTAERSRLANWLTWRALSANEGHRDWAFTQLASAETWFESLEPVLPTGSVAEAPSP